MAFFNNIFGGSNHEIAKSKVDWRLLVDVEQLKDIVQESDEKLVLLFKHSTRCSVSRMVLKQFENDFNFHDKINMYFLDLLEHRDISNAIAVQFDVMHQSPQIILISKGVCIHSATHENIDASALSKFL